jgi:hypothetical protein
VHPSHIRDFRLLNVLPFLDLNRKFVRAIYVTVVPAMENVASLFSICEIVCVHNQCDLAFCARNLSCCKTFTDSGLVSVTVNSATSRYQFSRLLDTPSPTVSGQSRHGHGTLYSVLAWHLLFSCGFVQKTIPICFSSPPLPIRPHPRTPHCHSLPTPPFLTPPDLLFAAEAPWIRARGKSKLLYQ